jgi:hypothetical protein
LLPAATRLRIAVEPAQKLDQPGGVTEQLTAGSVPAADTLVYLPPVTA